MPDFMYRVRDGAGNAREGRREAPDAASLSRDLRAEGLLVLEVREDGARGNGAAHSGRVAGTRSASSASAVAPGLPPRWHPAWLLPIASLDVELGLRQAASMLRSGVALSLALQTVSAQSRRPRAARSWATILDRIRTGESLSDSMAAQRGVFPEEVVQLVRVGEHSGELDTALGRAADQMAARREIRSLVANALIYPCLAILMAIGVSVFLVVSVIPKIAAFLQQGNTALPPLTQALMDASYWIRANGMKVLACAAAAVAAWFAVRMGERGRELEDAALLRVPVAGRVLRISGTAVFARVMAMLVESGVTLLDSLQVVGRVMGNRRLARRIETARDGVMRGVPLSAALAEAREFLPMLARMTAVAETTGSLGVAFDEVARFHETLLAITVKRLSAAIEPVTIIVTGAIVGFVYIAFFLALFSMANAV